MPLLCCTSKLLTKLPDKSEANLTDEQPGGPDDWYVGLLMLGKRQALIFTHAESFFIFFVYNVSQKELADIKPLFYSNLEKMLLFYGVSRRDILRIIFKTGNIQLAKTRKCPALGIMKGFAVSSRRKFNDNDELSPLQVTGLAERCNMMNMEMLDYLSPHTKFDLQYGLMDEDDLF